MADVYGEYFDFEYLQLWKYEWIFPRVGYMLISHIEC